MAEVPKQTIQIGSAPLRVVAGHARRLGETWTQLGEQFEAIADSLDDLVAGGTREEAE